MTKHYRTDLDSILTPSKAKSHTQSTAHGTDTLSLESVGAITKVDGNEGHVMVKLSPDADPDEVFGADHLLVNINGGIVPMRIESVTRRGAGSATVALASVTSTEQAQMIVGCKVCAPTPTSDNEEELDDDSLIGYELIDTTVGSIGSIEDIDDTVAANPLFVVGTVGGTVLIPAADELIEMVDDERKVILMHVPQGLLDIDSVDAVD